MAIIKNRKTVYTNDVNLLKHRLAKIVAKIEGNSTFENVSLEDLPSSIEDLKLLEETIKSQIQDLNSKIQQEEEKYKNWSVENIRRKHNYIPLLVNMLKILADKGELIPLIQRAQKKS